MTSTPLADDLRWGQVQQRRTGDQPFVYAVRTTGIYCLPTCPSRRPLRANVCFFASGDDARAAGFRACRRCEPDQASGTDPQVLAVVAACRAMLDAGGPLPSAELERVTGLAPRALSRAFEQVLGASPRALGQAVRTGSARELLRRSGEVSGAVTGAVVEAGFGSVRAFYETTAPTLGMAPSAYAAGAAGERLGWTSVPSPVGTVLAVASERGLCAVRLGEDVEALLDEVRREFPRAELVPDHEAMSGVAQALAALAGGGRWVGELPVDLRGTAFQARVWAALRLIPPGETRSYRELAAEVGAPAAVRAVAGACAANRIALAVPCHRVVRSDGGLGGFRWGLAVKRSLLDAERLQVHPDGGPHAKEG